MLTESIVNAACVLLAVGCLHGSGITQKIRTIPFSFSTPIAEQLLPDDEIVIVNKAGTGDLHDRAAGIMGGGTLSAQLDILARADGIAVVDVIDSRGAVVKNGTWIDTVTTARIVQNLKAAKPLESTSGAFEFSVENGDAILNGVSVRAGAYPVLPRGSRALVILSIRRSCSCWILGEAYSVSRSGQIGSIKKTNGSEFGFRRALLGLPLEQVIQELEARLRM